MNNNIDDMNLSMRDLYNKIILYKGENLYDDILKTWVTENNYNDYLNNLSSKLQIEKISELPQVDIWELYALSRVLDILTLQLQPNNILDGSDWLRFNIDFSINEYIEFNKLLGLEIFTPNSFNTFDCEIIEAKEAELDFQIDEIFFPGLKLNKLMIKRAGTKITLNPKKYNLSLTNNSTMYWTFVRRNRCHNDLSHGWGHNSQWRTDFRLDIETDKSYIYNLKGIFNLNNTSIELKEVLNQENLEIQEAIELVKYRHLINYIKDNKSLFPYDFMYEELK